MNDIYNLEKRVEIIEKRNKSVETNKAWETSKTRKLLIASFTYLIIGVFMQSIAVQNPWINAVIPTLGFLLSTLSLSLFKKIWEKYQ